MADFGFLAIFNVIFGTTETTVMLFWKTFSFLEKLSSVLFASLLALVVSLLALKIRIPPAYPDFIVGYVGWQAETKLQDLLVAPAFVFGFAVGFFWIVRLLTKIHRNFGVADAKEHAAQLLWWCLPWLSLLPSLMQREGLNNSQIFIFPALGTLAILLLQALVSLRVSGGKIPASSSLSAGLLVVLWLSLIPLACNLFWGRLPLDWQGAFSHWFPLSLWSVYILFILGILGFLLLVILAWPYFVQWLPRFLVLAQVALPVFFLVLYPARILTAEGVSAEYPVRWFLFVLIGALVFLAYLDLWRRYQTNKHLDGKEWYRFLSPLVLFTFIAIKFGQTSPPDLFVDDYHYGEFLLGWWSYLQGVIPYVGYMPPHGILENDLAGLLATLFYDGTAGVLPEAIRLAWILMAFLAYLAIYRFSGSLGLAFVCLMFSGGRLSWFFLTPFLCLWFDFTRQRKSLRWILWWMLTAPLVVLAIPPQGVLLVATSGILVCWHIWQLWCRREFDAWKVLVASAALWLIFIGLTPLGAMLQGAISYVFINAPVNQVAYGIPWKSSWEVGAGRALAFVLDLVRMSWMLLPLVALGLAIFDWQKNRRLTPGFLVAVAIFIFVLLLSPYTMGRIDPGALSRPGLIAGWGWFIFLPLLLWPLLNSGNRMVFLVSIALMGVVLNFNWNFRVPSFANLLASVASYIDTPPLRQGQEIGLPNIGNVIVNPDHWDRLSRLSRLLSHRLEPQETYWDLTNRNAQYFYLNRLPPIPVSAPYNMPSALQQQEAVSVLKANLPRLALLEADNVIWDGGGLSLRNPLLYRLVMEQYTPAWEEGFVVGYRKDLAIEHSKIQLRIEDKTDSLWIRGLHRVEPALLIKDAFLLGELGVGDRIFFMGEGREITKIDQAHATLWFSGKRPEVDQLENFPGSVELTPREQEIPGIQLALLDKAFRVPELGKIPLAWGRSQDSLTSKMQKVQKIDADTVRVVDLLQEPATKNYQVTGKQPQMELDLTDRAIAGRDVGLLKLDFACQHSSGLSRVEVSWSSEAFGEYNQRNTLFFTAENGTLIVPLDAYPRWFAAEKISKLRMVYTLPSDCLRFDIDNIWLYKRIF